MCEVCWKDAGSPQIWNKKVELAVKLITAVYEIACTGGNLHAQIDDYNLDEGHFQEFNPYFKDITEEQATIEQECFKHLQTMSEDERYSAVAFYDEYWKKETK